MIFQHLEIKHLEKKVPFFPKHFTQKNRTGICLDPGSYSLAVQGWIMPTSQANSQEQNFKETQEVLSDKGQL